MWNQHLSLLTFDLQLKEKSLFFFLSFQSKTCSPISLSFSSSLFLLSQGIEMVTPKIQKTAKDFFFFFWFPRRDWGDKGQQRNRNKYIRTLNWRKEAIPNKQVKSIKEHLCRDDMKKIIRLHRQFHKSTHYSLANILILEMRLFIFLNTH